MALERVAVLEEELELSNQEVGGRGQEREGWTKEPLSGVELIGWVPNLLGARLGQRANGVGLWRGVVGLLRRNSSSGLRGTLLSERETTVRNRGWG